MIVDYEDQLARELEDAKAQNARLLALLRECRTAIVDLMAIVESKGDYEGRRWTND